MLAKQLDKQLPTVVLVGRTNVGKSTLFNALTEKKKALVSDIAGTTRDANIGQVSWQNSEFTLIDTGGFMDFEFLRNKKSEAETIDEKVQKQARDFLTRADLVLFMVDNKDGLLKDDDAIAKILKKILPEKNKLFLVVNKVDSGRYRNDASAFFKLNLGTPHLISSATGSGTGDLLDAITDRLAGWQMPANAPAPIPEGGNEIRACLLGKPNVGKSSLLNAILGYDRVIVSPEAHTTREPQDMVITYKKQTIRLVDTAGIHRQGLKGGSKKAKDALSKRLEHRGIEASLRTLDQSDIAILVLDINEGLTKQDVRLVEEIIEHRKSLLIIANKWDLVKNRDTKKHTQDIHKSIPFAHFAPIQFISAKTHEKVDKVLDQVMKLDHNRHLFVPQVELDAFIKYCVSKHLPTKGKGQRYPRVRNFRQTGTNPPEFAVKVGAKEFLAESYLGFLTNRLRERYELTGTPVKMWVEKNASVHGMADRD